MTPLADFLPFVSPEVPGCPLAMQRYAAAQACRTLARDTWLVREGIEVETAPGKASYALESADEGVECFGAASVLDDRGLWLKPVTARPQGVSAAGRPFQFWVSHGLLWLAPTPVEASVLNVDALVQPEFGAQAVPDGFAEYGEAVRYWTLYELLSMTSAPWANAERAAAAYQAYHQWIGKDKRHALGGGDAAALRAIPPFF
jgi:hypothetical protein